MQADIARFTVSAVFQARNSAVTAFLCRLAFIQPPHIEHITRDIGNRGQTAYLIIVAHRLSAGLARVNDQMHQNAMLFCEFAQSDREIRLRLVKIPLTAAGVHGHQIIHQKHSAVVPSVRLFKCP